MASPSTSVALHLQQATQPSLTSELLVMATLGSLLLLLLLPVRLPRLPLQEFSSMGAGKSPSASDLLSQAQFWLSPAGLVSCVG